jgi:ethanolamine utilization cobalamin adenosyltransferase
MPEERATAKRPETNTVKTGEKVVAKDDRLGAVSGEIS